MLGNFFLKCHYLCFHFLNLKRIIASLFLLFNSHIRSINVLHLSNNLEHRFFSFQFLVAIFLLNYSLNQQLFMLVRHLNSHFFLFPIDNWDLLFQEDRFFSSMDSHCFLEFHWNVFQIYHSNSFLLKDRDNMRLCVGDEVWAINHNIDLTGTNGGSEKGEDSLNIYINQKLFTNHDQDGFIDF